ncbi:prolyl oligopeptidase family serine peptidase [Piscinibacter sp. XHJ-5]|uniref:S9 family peptidase n=1 Tax=Piscinibacter sp. XHJ-5 TaxID=3037797 RepID=UPI0024536C26|nr:prolyl oligopeptidase family serine peptidase [Piscinibacter sp. XHJ-5]
MPGRTIASFGTWASPITAQRVASASRPLSAPHIDGSSVVWLEGLPGEGGRVAAMRSDGTADSPTEMLTAAPYNVRSRVHEYGGGACIAAGGVLYFSHYADNLVYRRAPDGAIEPLTHESRHRHADFELDAPRQRLIAVREDHAAGGHEPRNLLVALPLDGRGDAAALASGHDFYAAPRLSPDGRRLAWLCWNHPLMPFQGTELWLADVSDDGRLVQPRRLAGGADDSLCQPQWSPDGQLFVVSDRSGFWNLHRMERDALQPLCPTDAEFARPQWVFGRHLYGFHGAHEIIASCIDQGVSRLGRIDVRSGAWQPIATDRTDFEELQVGPGFIVAIAGSPTQPQHLLRIDLDSGAHTVLARSATDLPDAAWLARPESLAFESEGGRIAHAFHYPPTNPDFEAPPGERPPLIVTSHGGPTSMSGTSLRLPVNFWTSRGFAVLDVNYGGSTGFGRAYMETLKGQWGIVDVQDCVAAARHLAQRGSVDPQRMAIRGSSASGYTTLCALIFHDVFKAGASYFGVTDLAALDADTHKFESRYTEYLVAPPPERERLYRERSPALHADRLKRPVIFFQGLDDKVVLPSQSQGMVEAMKARGVPVAFLAFEGEGHGFRRLETLRRTLEAELYFYGRVFGFAPADAIEPVTIAGELEERHGR